MSCQERPQDKPTGEFITRKENEVLFLIKEPLISPLPTYPWEKPEGLITKHHFHCQGTGKRREIIKEDGSFYLEDCDGLHSLPLREGKGFIYPILIDLLNFLQKKTGKEVVITSGHSCPLHNKFLNPHIKNAYSKHQIGGEVSLYVKGMEKEPERVISYLKSYYQNEEKESWRHFSRYEKETNVSTPPWFNHEIFIKLFKETEGRSIDNNHPYPYISIQVRYDREKKERVIFKEELTFVYSLP